ncbi:hypothetical protein AALP_AA8G323700 [Arabis alpina]|uniref:Reverse transcriptase Ty1/copia-type domain-containing protein n=1 Tax=Arabis alpina TaxID=50452 RepID=A0A087GAW5_ARAAL|nr:hypothetical protein AALP_AA8G323700 [Arabis alpina]
MHSPRESHGQAIKHILRYLRGTTNLGLFFKRDGSRRIIGYSDSSHNIDVDDGRSTSGHVFYLGSSPITWTSQKQPTVALSSCEAEFMAATETAKQAIWLKELMKEVMSIDKKVTLRIDNKSAMALTKNSVFHGRKVETIVGTIKSDLIFYNSTSWIPETAKLVGAKTVCFNIVSAAFIALSLVPVVEREIIDGKEMSREELAEPPVSYPSSKVVLLAHEATTLSFVWRRQEGVNSFFEEKLTAMRNCDAIAIRTCRETEGKFCDYVGSQYNKQVYLTGPVHPGSEPNRVSLEPR